MTSFAENQVIYSDGQYNVVRPDESILENGFIPKTSGARGQALPAAYLNWLFREVFRKINDSSSADNGDGNASFVSSDFGVVTIYSVVKTDPSKFIHAVGYKVGGLAPVMQVLQSATLSLGVITSSQLQVVGALPNDIASRISVVG